MSVDKNKISAEATRLLQKGQLDKAIRAYERILGADPSDTRALLKIGEIQQKKGEIAAAAGTFTRVAEAYGSQGFFLKSVAVYKQVLKLTPDEVRVNERLAQLYQQLGLVSEAMAQLHAIVRLAEQGGDDEKLLEALRRVVEIDPDHVPSAVKLGELYTRLGQPNLAVEHLRRAADQLKLNSRLDEYARVAERIAALLPDDQVLAREVASVLVARGDARGALQKLLPCYRVDPRQVETLTLLAQVFQELGQDSKVAAACRELGRLHSDEGRAGDALAAWQRVVQLEPSDPEAAEALTASALHEQDSEASTRPSPADATRPGGPESRPTGAMGRVTGPTAGASPGPTTPGPEAAVAKLLDEADVYVKYGLHEKALEHLRKILAGEPDHVDAREKASRILELRKDLAGAADEQIHAIEGARARGLTDRARAGLERLRQLSPAHPALAQLASAEGAAPPAEADDEGVVLELDDGQEPPSDQAAEVIEEVIELDPMSDEAPPAEVNAPKKRGADELALSAAVPEGDEVEEGLGSDEDAILTPTPEDGAGSAEAPPPPEEIDDALEAELAEADFFLSQGLLEEAQELLSELRALHPAHARIEARITQLPEGAAGTKITAPRPAPPKATASGTPTAPAAPRGRPTSTQHAIVPPAPDYLYSVRDVLEPFKKGIEQTVTPADSQTHYDLGIAYKEMGLLGDAVHEFEVASQGSDGARRLDCLMLIGLCQMESGDHAHAIEAYRSALAGGATDDLRCALEYHLALAYEAAGDPESALHYLNGVIAADPDYRDARDRLAQLGGGPGRAPAADANPAAPVAGAPASVRHGR